MRIENATLISPLCPTCGKEMKLTGYSPMCEGGMIYDFSCGTDGDRLTWRHVAATISRSNQRPASRSMPAR